MTNITGTDHQRHVRIKNRLHSVNIIRDVELVPSLLIRETHLHNPNTIDN